MIDTDDIRAFMGGFYGYGRYETNYWFVGLEEGGARTINDLSKRVDVWRRLGSHEVADLYEFHEELGPNPWFGAKPRRQSTWARLIQIVLTAEGRSATNDDILQYQTTRLGRSDGETLLTELMPLPAKNLSTWYAHGLNIPELRSRTEYTARVRPRRIAHLKKRIAEHQPRVVVFYGARRWWPDFLGIPFLSGRSCDHAFLGQTLLLTMKPPTAYGARREDFDEVARSMIR